MNNENLTKVSYTIAYTNANVQRYQLGLRSKYPELNAWPIHYKKAKGIMIDQYMDMAYMGIKSNILGYADEKVNKAVKKAIDNGNMSSLNPINEETLTYLLLELHPEMDLVRYARTGGEACKIAYDIGCNFLRQTYSNQLDFNINFFGYNGWHLKDLRSLKFIHYYKNNINEIIKQFHRPDIIFFELKRFESPTKDAINLLELWQKNGTILICDEITSGFRFHCGGVYQFYGLKPDIVIFGKAMSNGYPMAAIMGKKRIMKSAEGLWISSTYFTESIGPTAAIATIKELRKKDYSHLTKISQMMLDIWNEKFIDIKTSEPGPLINFRCDKDHQSKKLKYCKFMLNHNILATDAFFPSFAHKKKHIDIFYKIIKQY